jgi:hypothetical protein
MPSISAETAFLTSRIPPLPFHKQSTQKLLFGRKAASKMPLSAFFRGQGLQNAAESVGFSIPSHQFNKP